MATEWQDIEELLNSIFNVIFSQTKGTAVQTYRLPSREKFKDVPETEDMHWSSSKNQ